MTTEFLLTSLAVILLPGPGVLYTLAIGLGRGFRMSIFAAAGCTLGIVPHALASIAGLAALLHTSAVAFQTVKVLGVLYLFYMAWQLVRDNSVMSVSRDDNAAAIPSGGLRVIRDGVLINIFNPKLSLFFLAFLPQFVHAGDSTAATVAMLALTGVFMMMSLAVCTGYGALAAIARDYVISRPDVMKWLRCSFAGVFGALGLRLALSDS